jgi:hypothetical protein
MTWSSGAAVAGRQRERQAAGSAPVSLSAIQPLRDFADFFVFARLEKNIQKF